MRILCFIDARYERVLPGEICCPDFTEDRVSIGKGDSCCGSVPFTESGAQVCCSGQSLLIQFVN